MDSREPRPSEVSLWDLAHRWHDEPVGPDEKLPPAVRDTLTLLLTWVVNSQLALYEPLIGKGQDGSTSLYMQPVDQGLPASIETAFLTGRYSQNDLGYYRVALDDVFVRAISCSVDFPDFIVNEDFITFAQSAATTHSSRPEHEDRQRCQNIAQRLWGDRPSMRIAEVARHPEIQKEGNGGLYRLETVIGWVRVVAPEGIKGRPGRPPKPLESEDP